MTNDQDPPKKPVDDRPNRHRTNLVWYVVAAACGVAVVCYWVGNVNTAKVNYPQFVTLIKNSARDSETGEVLADAPGL